MDAVVIVVQAGAGELSVAHASGHAGIAAIIILGAIAVLGGAGWLVMRKRKVMAAPHSEVAATLGVTAAAPDAAPGNAPPDDDAGDLTVLMRRQA